MPPPTDNYSLACIYSISIADELIYIGSTANFHQRQRNHKSHFTLGKSMSLYDYLLKHNLIWDDVQMKVLENYPITEGEPLEKKRKLEERERELILEHKPICNTGKPASSHKDYLEYQRTYHQTVRKHQENYRENCIKASAKYRETHKDTEEFKEKKSERDKQYYETKGKERKHEKIPCPTCGKMLARASIPYHKKTQHN